MSRGPATSSLESGPAADNSSSSELSSSPAARSASTLAANSSASCSAESDALAFPRFFFRPGPRPVDEDDFFALSVEPAFSWASSPATASAFAAVSASDAVLDSDDASRDARPLPRLPRTFVPAPSATASDADVSEPEASPADATASSSDASGVAAPFGDASATADTDDAAASSTA